MHDAGQRVVEGEVVPLEGEAGQGGTVLPHLLVVVAILGGILEEITDGQPLIVDEVASEEDRALAEVGAELEQVALSSYRNQGCN